MEDKDSLQLQKRKRAAEGFLFFAFFVRKKCDCRVSTLMKYGQVTVLARHCLLDISFREKRQVTEGVNTFPVRTCPCTCSSTSSVASCTSSVRDCFAYVWNIYLRTYSHTCIDTADVSYVSWDLLQQRQHQSIIAFKSWKVGLLKQRKRQLL